MDNQRSGDRLLYSYDPIRLASSDPRIAAFCAANSYSEKIPGQSRITYSILWGLRRVGPPTPCSVRNVELSEPLFLPDQQTRTRIAHDHIPCDSKAGFFLNSGRSGTKRTGHRVRHPVLSFKSCKGFPSQDSLTWLLALPSRVSRPAHRPSGFPPGRCRCRASPCLAPRPLPCSLPRVRWDRAVL